MLKRNDKEAIVTGLKENIENAKAVFLTNMIGIEANTANALRKQIREAEGTVVVTRNTLFARAAAGTKCEELLSGLKGPNAVAFSFKDAPAVAKALYDAGKENELVTLQGGLLGDKTLTPAEVVELAKLPSRDQMLATLLATFNAPVGAFARVLHAIKEQKEQGGEAAPAEEAPADA